MGIPDDLGAWIMDRTNGDPADALAALCEVAAELIKLSNDPATSRRKFLNGLDGFAALPSRMFEEITRQ